MPVSAIWNMSMAETETETGTLALPVTVHCDDAPPSANAPVVWLGCCNRPVELK